MDTPSLPGSSGFTFISGPKLSRGRFWVGVVGGPLATVALVVGAFKASHLDLARFNTDLFVVELAMVINTVMLAHALLPVRQGLVRSDGFLLLSTPFVPAKQFQHGAVMSELLEMDDALERGELERAHAVLAAAKRWVTDPDTCGYSHAEATLWLIEGEFERALATFERLLQSAPTPDVKAVSLNNVAWACFGLRTPSLQARAAETSELANEAAPRSGWAQGTRGAVLYWLGRHDEARDLLESAYFMNSSTISRSYNAACLSLLEVSVGDLAAAKRWLEAATVGSWLRTEAAEAVAQLERSTAAPPV